MRIGRGIGVSAGVLISVNNGVGVSVNIFENIIPLLSNFSVYYPVFYTFPFYGSVCAGSPLF
jgi:hypothetical protein